MMGIKWTKENSTEEIRPTAGVANKSQKITEASLIWLGKVERQLRCSNDNIEGKRRVEILGPYIASIEFSRKNNFRVVDMSV